MRRNRWFVGLPPVALVLVVLQFVVSQQAFAAAFVVSWVLLMVLGGFALHRGILLSRVNRYLDPDVPVSRD